VLSAKGGSRKVKTQKSKGSNTKRLNTKIGLSSAIIAGRKSKSIRPPMNMRKKRMIRRKSREEAGP